MTESAKSVVAPAPWVCFRTYSGDGDEYRSIVSNERNHTTVFLEGKAAKLWSVIERGITLEQLLGVAASHGCENELDAFLSELTTHGLIADGSSEEVVAEPPPVPKALEDAANADPEHQLMEWVARNGYLYSVHWEVTYRCNEKCVHCYNPGAAHTDRERPQRETEELTTEEACRLIDEFVEAGVFRLTLSGGEVTLRKDFLDLVSHARKRGMSVHVYTNGLKLTDRQIDDLARLWPSSVSISVYSAEPDLHDQITRVPKSFERSVENLKKLRDKGIKTYLKSTQFAHTVHGWHRIQELAASVNAGAEIDMHLSAGVDGAKAPLALAVTNPAELIVMAATPGSPLYVGTEANQWGAAQKDFDATVCGAGIGSMGVGPEGNIYPCNSLPIPSGNFRAHGFAAIWRAARRHRIARKADRLPSVVLGSVDEAALALARWQEIRLRNYHECGTHERCKWCSKCPGLAMLEHGDPLAPATVNCRLATARMLAAKMLAAGDTRDGIAQRLGVNATFGTQRTRRVIPIVAETRRGTTLAFDPKESARQTLLSGVQHVSTRVAAEKSEEFVEFTTHKGEAWLHSGVADTALALRGFDELREMGTIPV